MIINSRRFINYDTTGNYICYMLLVRVKSLLNGALRLNNEEDAKSPQGSLKSLHLVVSFWGWFFAFSFVVVGFF